jgi:hypothetical protein
VAPALKPDFLAEPAQYLAITQDIAACGDCQGSKRRLCREHRRILPKPLKSTWPRLYGDTADKPGTPTPEVAKATLTRKARQAKRVLQMKRRAGMWGLAKAILNA